MLGKHGLLKGIWKDRPFQKGNLKYVVLDLIKNKPSYGYEIIKALEERSHGFYSPSPGVVYPTLQLIEEMGFASSAERDGKKVFTITEEGLQFLDDRKDLADEVKTQMKKHWNPEGIGKLGETMGEFGKIAWLMRHHFRHTDPEKRERIHEIVVRAHQEIEDILDEKSPV